LQMRRSTTKLQAQWYYVVCRVLEKISSISIVTVISTYFYKYLLISLLGVGGIEPRITLSIREIYVLASWWRVYGARPSTSF